MEFVIILLVVLFVVLYRQSNGTSVYKFVVSNVEIVYESTIKEINEINGQVDSVVLSNDRLIDVNGVFIYIGFVPNNAIIEKFDILDESGYVKNIITDVKGLYAVGDIVKKDVNQLIVAANDGVLVANHIINN